MCLCGQDVDIMAPHQDHYWGPNDAIDNGGYWDIFGFTFLQWKEAETRGPTFLTISVPNVF